VSYGNSRKKIMFYDTDKRHADLKIRLQHDALSQSEFFRAVVTGYLDKCDLIVEFINEYKSKNRKQSIKNISTSERLIMKGKNLESKLNLNNDEREDIFDIIAKEHPDL